MKQTTIVPVQIVRMLEPMTHAEIACALSSGGVTVRSPMNTSGFFMDDSLVAVILDQHFLVVRACIPIRHEQLWPLSLRDGQMVIVHDV